MDENRVGLVGYLNSRSNHTKKIYNKSLYTVTIKIPRESGCMDMVMVMAPWDAFWEWEGRKVFDLLPGEKVIVQGRMQTHRDVKTGKCKVFVLADYVAPAAEHAEIQNTVHLTGIIANNPFLRESHKGKRISDVILKVPSAFAEGFYSFVPVVTWGPVAEKVQKYKEGRIIEIEGRYQSRAYRKRLEDGTQENRIAFEISANMMKKKGFIENIKEDKDV